ncbi:MAG: flagellar hook-length control protein FliK [Desulfobulbaceae bacterium]|nr:flagellar hook-length control protein FliK [Desulfobulbaceae bacterium]
MEQQLRIDQVVRATVSEGGEERVWLNIGRQRVLAETEIPLRTGIGLTLLVSKISPRLEFQVLHDPLGSLLRQNLHLLEIPWSLEEVAAAAVASGASTDNQVAWERLLAFPEALAERGEGGVLAKMLAGMGIDYEARLAQGDTAGISTVLKKLLEDIRKPGRLGEAVGEKVEQFSSLLELWQLVRLKQSQQSVEFWPLLLPWVEQGFMLAERGQGGGPDAAAVDEARPWRVTVHLQLPQLGAIQIDFLWEQSGLYLRFKCETQDQLRLFSGSQEALRSSVVSLPLEGVAFAVGAQAPATILARLMGGEGIVDERI